LLGFALTVANIDDRNRDVMARLAERVFERRASPTAERLAPALGGAWALEAQAGRIR
jgi:hypothetical protein